LIIIYQPLNHHVKSPDRVSILKKGDIVPIRASVNSLQITSKAGQDKLVPEE
jgi:hypothetical protein